MTRDSWFVLAVVAILFFSAVEEVRGALLSVSRDGCGQSKLCVESPMSCEPNGSSSCLFTSAAANQSELSFTLRGSSAGYIALGLTSTFQNQGVSTLFVCAQNDSHVFFRTVQRNNSDLDGLLTLLDMPVMNFSGEVNGSVITCRFSVPLSNITLLSPSHDTVFTLLLGTGAVGTDSSLEAFNISLKAGPMDLVNFKNEMSTTAAPVTTTPTELSISRAGCGQSKLCVESPVSCEPNGSSPCLFFSAAADQSELSLSLRGDSAGFIALGLTNTSQGVSWFFVCGEKNGSFFFETALRNNSVQNAPLTRSNMSVEGVRGEVSGNVTKCIFNIQIQELRSTTTSDFVFQVILGTGAVNGTDLGTLKENLKTGALDLSNPKATSAPPTAAPTYTPIPGRAVFAGALLSALILPILLTVTLAK